MRLLIVEDFAPLRESLAPGLRDSGFAVDETGAGREGLWLAESNPYDVIVLDLMLPEVGGLDILRRIRSRSGAPQPPVLILTARDSIGDRVAGLDSGADDYLVKPFAFEELLARVRALVRRGYQQRAEVIEIDGLRLETSAQRVSCHGQDVKLTAREYALLEYLAFRHGQVVSRTDIWEHVYDFHSAATSNVVDVYIGYLRRKLDAPGRPPLIETVRGRGFRLGQTL